jgi:hypothetical protein
VREQVGEVVAVANGGFRSERSGSSGCTGHRETVRKHFGALMAQVMGQPSDLCTRMHNQFAVLRRTPAARHVHQPIQII